MLQTESLVLAKQMYNVKGRLRIPLVRSLAAVTKPSTSTKQLWRNTRKKIGPSASKSAVQDAKQDIVNALRIEKMMTKTTALKASGDGELPDYNWVPPAYRGIIDEAKPGNSVRKHQVETMQSKGMIRPRRVGKPRTDRYVLYSKDGVVDVPTVGLPEQAIIAKQRKEESMKNDILAFTKAASSYRAHLCDGGVANRDENQNESSVDLSSKSFQQQIASAIGSLHDEVTTNSKRIEDSAADFSSLCHILQQICSAAFHLSSLRKYNDQDASVYVDLAEFTLLGLVQINHDRLLLVKDKECDAKRNEKSEKESSTKSFVAGLFNQIVEGLTPTLLTTQSSIAQEEPNENDDLKKNLLDVSMLQSMKRLLRNVMTVIASTTKEPEIPLVATQKPSKVVNPMANTDAKSIDEALGRRMITLLEKTWRLGVRDAEATQRAMDVVARTGTLESARLCHEVYLKYSSVDRHVSFIVVLEAYLEALKRETDREKVQDIVDEVMNIQNNKPWSSHRVERVLQAATVLNCLAVADMGKVDGMCARAELIVKSVLREKHFIFFVAQVESDNPSVDSLLVPIANYLAQLYATSGDPLLEEKAGKLLKYAISNYDDFYNDMTIYPTVEACNAVLQALVRSANDKELSSVRNDYSFAREVLKVMFAKIEMGSCPNQTTYDCLFSLLEATDPSDIGTSGEQLLSYIETCNLLCVSSAFTLPYRTYYRVLLYYLKVAKDSNPFTEIDETNVPYRRAAHLLRKLEVRSTPMVLHNVVLGESAVEHLYFPHLRPYDSAYELVMQICANTSQSQYQEEAADVAVEIHRTRFQNGNNKIAAMIQENCSNDKFVDRVKEIIAQNV